MEAACSSETAISYHITARCHNTEGYDLNLHRRESFKSRMERKWPRPILCYCSRHLHGKSEKKYENQYLNTWPSCRDLNTGRPEYEAEKKEM